MGEIIISGNGKEHRYVINMLAQYFPGKPKYPHGILDGHESRMIAFKSCLDKIAKIDNLESIGFPYMIGCNMGGGDWIEYRSLIKKFSDDNKNIKTKVYKI